MTFFTTLRHAVRTAVTDVWRNIRLSFLTILLLLIALFFVDVFSFVKFVTDSAIATLEDRVEIVLYFQEEAAEGFILSAEKEVETFSGVREVVYVSADDALRSFQERHEKNASLTEALALLGTNPLGGRLIVRLQDPSAFQRVTSQILTSAFIPHLRTTDFDDVEVVIQKVTDVSSKARKVAGALFLFFALTALIAVYSTVSIRFATYHDDIGVMRIVGATKTFIRLPFFFLTVGYVLVAVVINTAISFALSDLWGEPFRAFFFGLATNPVDAFLAFLPLLSLWKTGGAIVLIGFSTFFALRRHLRTHTT